MVVLPALCTAVCLAAGVGQAPERSYLEAARGAARWLDAVAIPTGAGVTWRAAPGAGAVAGYPSLYAGSPGVVLFLLELSAADTDPRWPRLARAGADELLTSRQGAAAGAGLYTGAAGVGFALLETWRLTGDERYRAGALTVIEGLHAAARREEGRASLGAVTDVIAGDAGVAFFLLYASGQLERPRDHGGGGDLELALAIGRGLVARADRAGPDANLDWPMSPGYARRMPNYSHGTAGVASVLAALADATGDEAVKTELLDAALAGARHVLAVADHEGGGLLVPHHLPGGEDLFYMGWCHGPVGTSRLFLTLARVTGDDEWLDRAERCRRSLLACGLPEARTRGYWNNVGRCCGAAGVVEFLLDRRARTGSDADLPLARALADDVLDRATRRSVDGEETLSWIQSEHRVRPDLLVAQTGLMQGAAGVGRMFLHLDAALRGRAPVIRLPEDHAWGAPVRER